MPHSQEGHTFTILTVRFFRHTMKTGNQISFFVDRRLPIHALLVSMLLHPHFLHLRELRFLEPEFSSSTST